MRDSLFALLTLMLATAGCTTTLLQSSGPPAEGAPVLSCPGTCELIVETGAGSAIEPMVAADPGDADHLVVGSAEYETDSQGNTLFWLMAHVSFDAGQTWRSVRLPGGPDADPTHPLFGYQNTGDPSVLVLPDGTVLYAGGAARGAQRMGDPGAGAISDLTLFVARSTDGGLTYPEVQVVATGRGGLGSARAGGASAPFFTPGIQAQDKPFLAASPDGKTVLLTWTDVRAPTTEVPVRLAGLDIRYVVSTDGGKTWSKPATLAEGRYQGSFPVVAGDDVLHVAYMELPLEGSKGTVFVATSTDGGATWASSAVGAAHKDNWPSLAIDRGTGALRVSYAFLGENDTAPPALAKSTDGGATWSDPLQLDAPGSPGKTLPTLAAGPANVSYVGYYHPLTGDGEMEYRVVVLDGAALHGPVTVSATQVKPGPAQREYAGIAAVPGGAFVVWVGGGWPETNVHGARVAYP